MKFEKFLPSTQLLPFIKEFLIIESQSEMGNKIIPDTSIVMAFRFKGDTITIDEKGKNSIPDTVITGLRKSARHVQYSKDTANLLVIFHEGGINAFTKIPAHELFGLMISSENIFNRIELSGVSDRVAEAKTSRNRVAIIEAFLLKKLAGRQPDHIVNSAIKLIKQQSGIIRIKELAASLHISQDPFEKRFRAIVGATPKQYASIIRLRDLIKKYSSLSSLTDASYEAGYFDQSHFIKDFKTFTGESPRDFFKTPRRW